VNDNASVAAEIATWISSIISPINGFLSSVWVCYGLDIYVLQQGHWILSSENSFQHAGGASGEILPNQTALVWVAKTIVPRCLPKKFWGCIPESATVAGLWGSGILLASITAAAVWITPFTGGTSQESYVPGTYSAKHEQFIAFAGVLADNIPGSQRRRKPGVGI
jgi:hypothetical protein